MTTSGYGIQGIGYNPLGTNGLGMTGSYGSYDACMPSMMGLNCGMGMNSSIFGMGAMNPMMGMYNPLFMGQMMSQMEMNQLNHAGRMHTGVLNNEVTAHRETDSALMQKILTNSDIQQGVQNLYNKVREGDQDGICQEFDKLKSYVYRTYSDELVARGDKTNPKVAATQIIEAVYGNIISAQTGQTHDLRSDIKRYGDGAFKNGFLQGFRTDHHEKYVDETLNHCFGMQVDQKGSKDFRQGVGKGLGYIGSALEKGVYGAGLGVGLTGIGLGLGKVLPWVGKKYSWIKTMGKVAKPVAAAGLLAGIALDVFWSCTN